jgi:hypothetical protein
MQESVDLKEFVTQFFSSPDPERFISRQDGMHAIGTDPSEWIEGYEDNVAAWKAFVATESLSLILGDNLRAFSEGTIGWATSHAAFVWKERLIPARFTMIFRKEAGEWAAVHQHWSIGVPDEEAFS